MTSRLSAKSQPILIDFGIANAVGEQQVIAGSFPWLPPESDQALRAGMKLAAAPSMDIYAWGLTLYFIMTGIRPPAPTVQPTQLLIAAHTLTDLPVQRRAKVAAALNQLIQQSVATDPAARPNAQQLAAALEQLQQLLPAPIFAPLWQRSALAKVLTTGMVGRLFSQRWAWAGGAVVAALLGLAIIYAPGRTPKPAPTPVALAVQAATATTIGLTLATSTATVAPATVTATAPPATPTPVLLIATAPGASSAAASTAAVINTAVSTVDTPAATPTVITSPTRAPTSTPIPTATVTPTAPDTPTPIATATRPVARENPTTSVSAANPTLVLLEPLVDVLSGRQTFRWQTDVVLAQNQAFELILWAVGADPLANGFGPFGVTTATAVTGDLEAFVNATGSQYLANGRDYLWGVRLVERDPYRPLQYLGGAHRFRFQTNNRDDSPLRSPERAPAEKSASGP